MSLLTEQYQNEKEDASKVLTLVDVKTNLCSKCIYLGSEAYTYYEASKFDYYFCTTGSLIARYGKMGDYYSGITFAFNGKSDPIHPLRKAAILAMKQPELCKMIDEYLKKYYPERYGDFLELKKTT